MVNPITTSPLNPETFAARLTEARKHAGLTQHALAEAAGLHVSNIRRCEAGTNQPNIDALRNLALALGTSADQLLFEPHERQPDNDLQLAFEAASTRLDQEGLKCRYNALRVTSWNTPPKTTPAALNA